MTDTTTQAPVAAKVLTVADDMDQRRIFATPAEAVAYLTKCSTEFSDFGDQTLVLKGMDAENNFLPEFYTPAMRVMVAVLNSTPKDEKGNPLPRRVKAIVVTPVPTLDSIIASAEGKMWLDKLLDTQLNHIAVRALRPADDVSSVEDQIPMTLDGFISSSRDSSGSILETFNELSKGIITAIAVKSTPWAKRRLVKSEFKKCLESRAYALEYYAELEDRGDKPSLFVMAAHFGIKAAKDKTLDPTIFEKWLATRDNKTLKATTESEEDFSLDDLSIPVDAPATPVVAAAAA